MKPDFAKAYSERGRAKNLKGDKEGALADLKKAIELNPEGAEAQKLEGQHTNFDDMYKGGDFLKFKKRYIFLIYLFFDLK